MIKFGDPPAIRYEPEAKILKVKIAKPSNDNTLLENILEQLQHVEQANVCLSGGIDSQFMLRVAKKLNVPVTAYTYLTTWKGSPINCDDVVYAELVAKKEAVPLVKVEIDLYDFFSKKLHLQYARTYGVTSPQIAVHLYFIENTFRDKPGTVFIGGEMPMMIKDSSLDMGPLDIAGISQSFLMRNSSAYRKLCNKLNIDLVRDILLYTPSIIYQTLRVSIDLVEQQQIHCDYDVQKQYNIFMYPLRLKFAIYENIIPGGIDTLLKNTGFERLKKYLASQTGVYNQFDLQYRKQLEDEHRKHQRDLTRDLEGFDDTGVEGTVMFIAGNIPQELTDEYRAAIEKNNSKCIYDYSLDF